MTGWRGFSASGPGWTPPGHDYEACLVRVAYGRLTPEALEAARCMLCQGTGQTHTGWHPGLPYSSPGPLGACPRCDGSGDDLQAGFTYRSGLPVTPGDVVLVGVQRYGEPYTEQEATVLALGSTYEGEVRPIIMVTEHRVATTSGDGHG